MSGERPDDKNWALSGYTHGRELGVGAAGRVVAATHDLTGTAVAIKYLNPATAGGASFRAEATVLSELDSPHVTRLFEYVEVPQGQAIVMELVNGVSLRDLLDAEGATEPEAALTVLKGSLLGLSAAHASGVVHRDYKPGNVLVTAAGASKLVDFGIAVPVGAAGGIAGTPAYMAPEQWTGRPASTATDVYAATATFFECLTGTKPFAGATLVELAVQHLEGAIPDERAPEGLRPLIRRGLAKTPDDRPNTAADLVGELDAIALATYGNDWESTGRAQLAALVALVPLMLPLGGASASGITALATTVMGAAREGATRLSKRAKALTAGGAVVLLTAGLMSAALTHRAAPHTTEAVVPRETTWLTDGVTFTPRPTASRTTPTPSASAAGSWALASPTTSRPTSTSVAPPATARIPPSPPRSTPTVKPTPTGGPTPTDPAGPGPISPSSPPSLPPTALRVNFVALGSPMCWGRNGMSVPVRVDTDGAAMGTLTVTWTDPSGQLVGASSFDLVAGRKAFAFTASHSFNHSSTANGGSWRARAATDPMAARGQDASAELSGATCDVQ